MASEAAQVSSANMQTVVTGSALTNQPVVSQPRRDMDERVSMDLAPVVALRGLLMSREINESPEEAASLHRAMEQTQRGEVRWLDEDESTEDAIDED